jgi:hypothetical protein
MEQRQDQFVSEPITPVAGTADPSAMSRGEPGLPHQFTWRTRTYTIVNVLQTWKSSTRDRGELYLRRHWYRIVTDSGEQMTLYCERQAKNRTRPKSRWWIYSFRPAPSP